MAKDKNQREARNKTGKCGGEFVPADGVQSYVCDRENGLHFSHRDSDGIRFVRVPGGAIVTKSDKK